MICCFYSNSPKINSQAVKYGACEAFDDVYYKTLQRERDALYNTPPLEAGDSPARSIAKKITFSSGGPPSQWMSPDLSPVLPAVNEPLTEMTPRIVPIKVETVAVEPQFLKETAPTTVAKTVEVAKQFRLTVEDIIHLRYLSDPELRKQYDEFFSQVAPPRNVTFWSFR